MAGESKTSVIAALIGNTLIAVTKYTAAIFTGSSAMLAEAIHSTSDTGNQLLLLLGLNRAKKPADKLHPFGHGKEVYFWSLIVAVSLFGIGGGVSIYEGVLALMDPHPVESPVWTYVVLGLAFVFEAGSLTIAAREFWKYKEDRGVLEAVHEGKDPTFFVVLFEDSAAITGVIVAALGIYLSVELGIPEFDAAASIVIGLLLCTVALWLAWESKDLLVGESASEKLVNSIYSIIESDPAVVRTGKILTMHVGPNDVLVTTRIEFQHGLTMDELHEAVERIEGEICRRHQVVRTVFIEADSFSEKTRTQAGMAPPPESGEDSET